MKQFSLLVLLLPVFSFAQEFTKPDSAAIIKNRVKSVKVYYTGTGSTHLKSAEFHYNYKGQCIYESTGSSSWYYSKTYYDNGWLKSVIQRDNSGTMWQGWLRQYYLTGQVEHLLVFTEWDTLKPSYIYDYDRWGNRTGENSFVHGKLSFSKKIYYNSAGKITGHKDSLPGSYVAVHDTLHLLTEIFYDSLNRWKGTWVFEYDKNGLLSKAIRRHFMDKDDVYTFENGDADKMQVNYKPASQEKKDEWNKQWGYLTAKPVGEEYGLPYSDPVAEYEYKHEITRDKKGNISKDHIIAAYTWMHFEAVDFDYEYEFW